MKRSVRKPALEVDNLRVSIGDIPILRGISLSIRPDEVHAIMGPNGSGKSTFAYALMGHPVYNVHPGSTAKLGNTNILKLSVEARAKAGLFLALQSPIAIPGVSTTNILRTAYQEIHPGNSSKSTNVHNPLLVRRWRSSSMTLTDFLENVTLFSKELGIRDELLSRGIHDGLSGGEKKKIETLQALVLQPKYVLFDEIDTGLDVDALKIVAKSINILRQKGTGVIIITHYHRILNYCTPDVVHILIGGRIVRSGKGDLAKQVEENGYKEYSEVIQSPK